MFFVVFQSSATAVPVVIVALFGELENISAISTPVAPRAPQY